MTVRQIVQHPDPVLDARSLPVTVFDTALGQLVRDMVDTMRAAGGIGLAAVQIGVLQRAFIIETDEFNYQVYVNPKLLTHSRRLMGANEGCLSCIGMAQGVVVRPRGIEAVWQGIEGKRVVGRLTGLRARTFLHELDHLNGSLYMARVQPGDFIVGEEPKALRE